MLMCRYITNSCLVAMVIQLCLFANADAETTSEKLIRSRAKRGVSHGGTVVYNYNRVTKYDDELSAEALGNILLDKRSRVRRIFNAVNIEGKVNAADGIAIGNFALEQAHIHEAINFVDIKGAIDAHGGTHIGNIEVNNSTSINNILNCVHIRGDIDAR